VQRGGLHARRRSSVINVQRAGGVSSGRGVCRQRCLAVPPSLSGELRELSLVVQRRGGGSRSSSRASTIWGRKSSLLL